MGLGQPKPQRGAATQNDLRSPEFILSGGNDRITPIRKAALQLNSVWIVS